MAFAIVRTEKLKTAGNCGGLNNHLERTMVVPNADMALSYLNRRRVGSGDLAKDVAHRIQAAGIEKPRKNAVLAIEHLMTASPEAFPFKKIAGSQPGQQTLSGNQADVERWKVFEKNCMQWLQERYGKANLVNFTVHLDEQTPHIHAVVVPIDGKGKLNCRHYLGGREKLRDLQDSFATVHQNIGLERGIQGSKAHHTTVKQFYSQANTFTQAPPMVFAIDTPEASIEAPQTNFIGQMKEKPADYIIGQQKRLRLQWLAQEKKLVEQALQKTQALQQAAQGAQVLKLENQRLKGQLKGLQAQVARLTEQRAYSHQLLMDISQQSVHPQQINHAFHQLPKTEGERAMQEWLRQIGMTVKEPEIKQEERRRRGLRL